MTIQTGATINAYLNTNIKDIIQAFPGVADALNRFDIGCVTCALGTCQLKDIVVIHDLAPEDETALLSSIVDIVAPGSPVPVLSDPANKRKPSTTTYSPPLQKLVDEHKLITRFLALVPSFINRLDVSTEPGRELVRQAIDFIQFYADKYHHAKEEAILFKYFDENADIIKTMCADHETARARRRAMLTALEKRDRETIAAQMAAYRELLTEHIKKEDEILYRWMDRGLTTSQVGRLFASFQEEDHQAGGEPHKYEECVKKLENQLTAKEKNK